jgi:anti-sigma B factor antagonist
MADDLQLTVRRDALADALVVHVGGEIDLATAGALAEAFAGLEHEVQPPMPLVIDTTEVTFLSSAGLALLVEFDQRCSAAGVELRIAAGNRTVMRALMMTGLTDALTVTETLSDALGQSQP